MTSGIDFPLEATIDLQIAGKFQLTPESYIVIEHRFHVHSLHWGRGAFRGASVKFYPQKNRAPVAACAVNSRMDEQALRSLWKGRPSRIHGYTRCYESLTEEGDEIQVDFNFARQMVRIELTLAAEHGRKYAATVKSGTIIQERDLNTNQTLDLTSRFWPLRNQFRYLPDETLLRALGGAFGTPLAPELPRRRFERQTYVFRKLNLRERLRNYLKRRKEIEEEPAPFSRRLLRRLPAELRDLALIPVCLFLYAASVISLEELAFLAGFAGLMTGAVDWVLRQRSPFLPKVIFFLVTSGLAIFRLVEYRQWAIFL